MPKWAERAKAALGSQTSQFQKRSLEETIEKSNSIVEDVAFVMETSGYDASNVELSLNGLDRVEGFYRNAIRSGKNIELEIDNFERLMAVMLGQYLVNRNGARWSTYTGRHHVFDPIVIQLDDGKHVDVFLFCNSLSRKAGVSGASEGRALSSFVASVDRMAFP